jgi:DNA segregation ATPase FtsK/SpoIIIE, S-DNA-T family
MVTPVVTRAMAAITELRRTGEPPTDQAEDDEVVDHLADIHQALRGEQRVRTQVVLTRLAELNPAVYEGWSFQDLSAALAD